MGNTTKTVLIVLGIVGGVLLLLFLACGGLLFWGVTSFTRELPAAKNSAQDFLGLVKKHKNKEAHDITSRGFQAAVSREQFDNMLLQYPSLAEHNSISFGAWRIFKGTAGVHATLGMTISGPQGNLSFTMILIKEDDRWKVHHLNMPVRSENTPTSTGKTASPK